MAVRSDYFTEMINLHLLSLEKTFYAMDSYLGLNQKDEINMQIDKIKKVVYDLNGKLQKSSSGVIQPSRISNKNKIAQQRMKKIRREGFSQDKLEARSRWTSALYGNHDMKSFLQSSIGRLQKIAVRLLLRSKFQRWKKNVNISSSFRDESDSDSYSYRFDNYQFDEDDEENNENSYFHQNNQRKRKSSDRSDLPDKDDEDLKLRPDDEEDYDQQIFSASNGELLNFETINDHYMTGSGPLPVNKVPINDQQHMKKMADKKENVDLSNKLISQNAPISYPAPASHQKTLIPMDVNELQSIKESNNKWGIPQLNKISKQPPQQFPDPNEKRESFSSSILETLQSTEDYLKTSLTAKPNTSTTHRPLSSRRDQQNNSTNLSTSFDMPAPQSSNSFNLPKNTNYQPPQSAQSNYPQAKPSYHQEDLLIFDPQEPFQLPSSSSSQQFLPPSQSVSSSQYNPTHNYENNSNNNFNKSMEIQYSTDTKSFPEFSSSSSATGLNLNVPPMTHSSLEFTRFGSNGTSASAPNSSSSATAPLGKTLKRRPTFREFKDLQEPDDGFELPP